MREIRTSGSEGGESGQPGFPTPLVFINTYKGQSNRDEGFGDFLRFHQC